MDSQSLLLNVIMIAIFLGIAFPVHEFAHAAVAYARGDATAKLFGRMTLNPVVHFDPFGGLMTVVSIFIGGFLFGWAKPTPVNPANLRNRQNDEVLVALAGPASNLVMATLMALAIRLLDLVGVPVYDNMIAGNIGLARGVGVAPIELLSYGLYLFVVFNVMLAVFNMIPIPPLDGGTLLFRFLSPRQTWQIRPFLAQYGMFIVLAVVLIGGRYISSFIFSAATFLVGLRARQLRTHLTAHVSEEERRMLAAWLTPAELALFDAQHVADRRHGLEVAAHLRQAGVRDRDVLAAGVLHDCAKGDTGAGPRVAWTLGRRLGPRVLAPARLVPGWSAALDRLRDHAEASAALVEAAGLAPRAVDLVRHQSDPRDPEFGARFQAADEAC